MRLRLLVLPLLLSVAITGCKDKKVDEVETASSETESTVESTVESVAETEETERVEKNTIAVVGNVNLRENKGLNVNESENESIVESAEAETEEEVNEQVDLRHGTVEDTKETETKEVETDEKEEKEEKVEIKGEQYQNFSADMNDLENYKYVGYDGDSTVFLNIDDNKETTSMLVMIYRDNTYIQDKFGGIEDLGDEQKRSIGADLVRELTGINIDINQTDFRERESGAGGKYLGLSFGSSDTNNSGYLAFRVKKNKLECVIDTIDSTEPEDRKQMKDDVLKVLESINFNGEECDSSYDIAFDNINVGIQKMKNGE